MSLHALANHLQEAGRGGDKVLIHMTPKELSGLQSLAVAHGGSLTTNPETGLPEASFLSSILPTVIGAGLTIASGGALSPLMAAGITGAGYAAATGSLQKGLMAGLGAYGGAGLGAGLTEAGAEVLGANAASGAGETAANLNSATGVTGQSPFSISADKFTTTAPVENTLTPGFGVNNSFANIGSTDVNTMANSYMPSVSPVDNIVSQVNAAPSLSGINGVTSNVDPSLYGKAPGADMVSDGNNIDKIMGQGTPASEWDKAGAGFKKATGSWEGLKDVWNKTPTGTGAGLMAAGMGVMQDMQNKGPGAPAQGDSYLRPYEYSVEQNQSAYTPIASTAERKYFTEPRFTALPIQKVKEGGLLGLAIGGAVEDMSAMNSVSGNTMYPQSQLQTSMYSNPMVQRPIQNDVINAGLDTPTQPYTGEARMAGGGVARYGLGGAAKAAESTSEKKYAYDPQTMKFTETTTTTPAANQGFGIWGPGGDILHPGHGFTGYGIGMMGGPIAQLLAKQQAAQAKPTVTTETSGGIAAPYTPQGQAMGMQDTSMVPNTQIQPLRTPEQQLGLEAFYANMNQRLAQQGGYAGYAAGGGISTLGGYSDGGRLLKGPGDGVSDSIPASIGDRQPARLADGEFVVPARIVSELGNGSTEAGARKLYQMMERVQHARRKTVGKNQVAKNTKAEKLMPA